MRGPEDDRGGSEKPKGFLMTETEGTSYRSLREKKGKAPVKEQLPPFPQQM